MNIFANILNSLKNLTLNSIGVQRDLLELIQDRDISKAMNLFQNNDKEVIQAICEYNPDTHDVMFRPDKLRKKKAPYKVQKLPRSWQRYINEIALFFLLGNPIKWTNKTEEDTDLAFEAFKRFLEDTRFDTSMRQAKRLAGAETESAKLYHIYRDGNRPAVKVVVLSKSRGYTLRPLFDQYGNLIAFGYGYFLLEGGITYEHFDIETPDYIYSCKKENLGWTVKVKPNPTGKINVIYYPQPKEWEGSEQRINRDEHVDSKTGDTNEYFADPIAAATVDVIKGMADPEAVGKLIQLQNGKESEFRYIEPPTSIEMKDSEKKVLKESILNDTLTPDFSYENMKGLGTLSGEALKRAMIHGYIKRDNRKEIYEELIDREKNLILSIMKNITHIEMRDQLDKLNIKFEFSEPFNEDEEKRWEAIGKAVTDGIISLETAVELLSIVDDPKEELIRIKREKEDTTVV